MNQGLKGRVLMEKTAKKLVSLSLSVRIEESTKVKYPYHAI
jgi:hypothetical protein